MQYLLFISLRVKEYEWVQGMQGLGGGGDVWVERARLHLLLFHLFFKF